MIPAERDQVYLPAEGQRHGGNEAAKKLWRRMSYIIRIRESLQRFYQRCGKIDRSERMKLRKTCNGMGDQCEREAECCRKGYEIMKSEVDSTRQKYLMNTWYEFAADGYPSAHRRAPEH